MNNELTQNQIAEYFSNGKFFPLFRQSNICKKHLLPVIMILLVGCVDNSTPKTKIDTVPPPDTVFKDVYPKRDTGSKQTMKKEPDKEAASSGGGEGDDLQSIFDGYVARYKRPCVIDTSFSIATGRYTFHAEHTCLMDSGITVPKDYVYMYKLDSFVTHNFVTHVRLTRNDRTILERAIRKEDFDKVLYTSLQRYGALFCPDFRIGKGRILLHYSISIPLTDVGIGAYADVDGKGNVDFRNDH